ncbi:cell division cycle protein 20 homolog [Cuculus canorus]|uniref:cell division cycle protein 20 homolog n=1 Tax=Cuculus canorus TaxID=55661 RepID=UPI0023AB4E50|nr:cell division cycle protein 20 homolog [Cuculus canorus]
MRGASARVHRRFGAARALTAARSPRAVSARGDPSAVGAVRGISRGDSQSDSRGDSQSDSRGDSQGDPCSDPRGAAAAAPGNPRGRAELSPGLSPIIRTGSGSHSSSGMWCGTAAIRGSKMQRTQRIVGPDRYIPSRRALDMDVAKFQKDTAVVSPTVKERQRPWAASLNAFDLEKILEEVLRLSGKAQTTAAGYQYNLKALYGHEVMPGFGRRKGRYISSAPDRVLSAPDIHDDYYLTLLDWSTQNLLALALDTTVYLWHHISRETVNLMEIEHVADYVSSVSWGNGGDCLAVGVSNGEVQLWDVEHQKCLRSLTSHVSRVGCLSWNSYILSSGSHSGQIHHHDIRVAQHHVATLAGHKQEVCGLKWSLDGRYLASGGDDHLVNIWPSIQGGRGGFAPVQTFRQHQGAVKALAWCPWKSSILATGGGATDKSIRFWNVCSGACLGNVDAHSQVSSILWSTNYKELISGHGSEENQLVIWKYPAMSKVTELQGHTGRILSMALSPDGETVASAAADETLRLWRCFQMDPIRKKEKEKANRVKSSVLHQTIR